MISAVLIDYDKPALAELEFLLNKYSEITVAGTYQDPDDAIDNLERLKPDVVFMDINMPDFSGIDAAVKIFGLCPDTDIVFVTANDNYAVKAFELNALDYILKPVKAKRFEKTVDRIRKKKPCVWESIPNKLKIRCLGKFTVGWEGCEPIKWRTEKTKELFAYLLANAGRAISKDKIIDTLWGDDDPDKAIKQLYNGIYHIRKALESYGVDKSQISIDNSYNMKIGSVGLDVGRFYELSKDIEGNSLEELREMESLYEGDYLEGEYYLWAEAEREGILRIYSQCISRLSARYMEDKQFEKAEELLLKVFKKNSYDENIIMLLLKLYMETGNQLNAVRLYNIYANLIQQELGVAPDMKFRELLNFCLKNQKIF